MERQGLQILHPLYPALCASSLLPELPGAVLAVVVPAPRVVVDAAADVAVVDSP